MKKTALITGASSGIEDQLTIIYAAQESDLFLVTRNKSFLLKLKLDIKKSKELW